MFVWDTMPREPRKRMVYCEKEREYIERQRERCGYVGSKRAKQKKWCIVNKRENAYSDRERDVGI